MAIALPGVPPTIAALIQQNTLERVFHDALFPRLLYRLEATPELWAANLGETYSFTRTGLLPVDVAPLTPGNDPVPGSYSTEQWRAVASQFSGTIDTNMASSYVALASLFSRNTQQLGLNAGQTLNRLARNRLFTAYLSGETTSQVLGVIGSTTLQVATLSGFTEALQDGELRPVSNTNRIPVTFSAAGEPANFVEGAVPADPANPLGPGTLTLSVGLTTAVPVRSGVFAGTRARRLRVGGGATIDGIGTANILTLNDVISAVSRLRGQNVPPHADGYYHVHMPPVAEAQLFRDNHWQRQYQSLPDSYQYKRLTVGMAVNCIFYSNTEDPSAQNMSATQPLAGVTGNALVAPEIGAQVRNDDGLDVTRTIVTGGGALYEKYLDESKYITEAGVTGKIGNFSIVNGGAAVMTNRIRFTIRSPLDRLQQVLSQSWSWSGDFPVPSDRTSGDAAAFKRAVVIESAGGV